MGSYRRGGIPPHRVGRAELLCHADESELVAFEDFEYASKVHSRAAQSVDRVDNYAVHLAGFDVRQQLPNRRTIHIAAVKPPSS